MAQFSQERTPELRPKVGLKYGGEVHLDCTVCGKRLLDIIITRPDFKFDDGTELVGRYKAKCCYCGNFSKEHEIYGGIATINIAEKNDQGQEVMKCYMEDFDIAQDGITIFHIKEFKKAKN